MEKNKRQTHTSSAVKRRYNDKTYDNFHLVLRKGQKDFLKSIAAEHSTTANEIINAAIAEYLLEHYNIDFSDYPKPLNEQTE